MRAADEPLAAAAQAIQHARRLVVLTGAGVSRESGIPTFRDALEGLWAQYDPQQLASPAGFRRDPTLVWQWYAARRRAVAAAQPNAAHIALARLGAVKATTLITQNVDGLHEAAGSTAVLHLHGALDRYKCVDRGHGHDIALETLPDAPPPCSVCGALLRPDVVWFGEMLPPEILSRAIAATEQADLMLVVGTSGLVHPAASLPLLAAQCGAVTIEVNHEATALTPHMTLSLRGAAGIVLPALVDSL